MNEVGWKGTQGMTHQQEQDHGKKQKEGQNEVHEKVHKQIIGDQSKDLKYDCHQVEEQDPDSNKFEIEIKRLTPEGLGVGYHQGKITFVPGWLPGETGVVAVSESKKNWQRANPVHRLTAAENRMAPACPIFSVCGGCQLQHLSYEETLRYKLRWIQENLLRIGKIETKVKPVIGMSDPWRYRNKATLHLQNGKMGYYPQKTNTVIQFEDCRLLNKEMNQWIKTVECFLQENMNNSTESTTVTFRRNQAGEGLIVLGKLPVGIEKKARNLAKRFGCTAKCSIWGFNNRGKLQHIAGPESLRVNILGIDFAVSPLAFLQVNSVQTEILYSKIVELADLKGTEVVWDLYCGAGTISLALAHQAGYVYGIEINAAAVRDAKKNALLNQITNVEFIAGKAEEELFKISSRPDAIILDPPRAGADRSLLEAIIKLQTEKVIYTSCDSRTLARDLAIMVEGGYEIVEVQPVDMFPWTGHVETVVLMSRVKD